LVGVSIDEASVMVAAPAEPEVLLVFGAIVTAMSTARLLRELGHPISGTLYITPSGLVKETSLPRGVIEKAAERLKRQSGSAPSSDAPAYHPHSHAHGRTPNRGVRLTVLAHNHDTYARLPASERFTPPLRNGCDGGASARPE
jgi:hypothetical protein